MRILLLLRLHFRVCFRRNLLNTILLIVETALLCAFTFLEVSNYFSAFAYKNTYFDREALSGYAMLAVDKSYSDRWEDTNDPAGCNELLDAVKALPGVADAAPVCSSHTQIDGLEVTCAIYDDCMDNLRQPTLHGRWIDGEPGSCVIGGALTELYGIGDTVSVPVSVPCEGIIPFRTEIHTYTVCDILREPYYSLSTNIGGTLSMYQVLETDRALLIAREPEVRDTIFSSLVLRLESEILPPDPDGIETLSAACQPYGKLHTGEMLVRHTNRVAWETIGTNLPVLLAVFFICLLISTSGILIMTERSRYGQSVLLLLGETKGTLLFLFGLCQGLVLFLGCFGGFALGRAVYSLFLGEEYTFCPEAVFASLFMTVLLFAFSLINMILANRGESFVGYQRTT